MPNAGIQAWRSTNWKSAERRLKRLHSSSVSAKTSSEIDQRDPANQRLVAPRRPRDQQQQERAGDRQSDERGQDRKMHQALSAHRHR